MGSQRRPPRPRRPAVDESRKAVAEAEKQAQ
jgi:hypothetical protein